jgi:hypothetical protein
MLRDVYRKQCATFFDELRAWFTKEAHALRKAVNVQKQEETDEMRSLRERVEKLETNKVVHVPTCAGDAAAGGVSPPRSLSPTGRLATEAMGFDTSTLRSLCRDEARRAVEELRGELLGGDLLCDELLNGGSGLRPALERLIAETPAMRPDREHELSIEVADLRASVSGAVTAATAAATAEIGRLDGAFRSSLAAEVRDLGCLCEEVRGRIESLDQSAAEHVGRLSARITELEELPKKRWAASDELEGLGLTIGDTGCRAFAEAQCEGLLSK